MSGRWAIRSVTKKSKTLNKKRPKRPLFICLLDQDCAPFGTGSGAGLKSDLCSYTP
jgi:hypothetical protein